MAAAGRQAACSVLSLVSKREREGEQWGDREAGLQASTLVNTLRAERHSEKINSVNKDAGSSFVVEESHPLSLFCMQIQRHDDHITMMIT